MVSCQKGPTRHAYAWQIGPFWQDTLDVSTEATNALIALVIMHHAISVHNADKIFIVWGQFMKTLYS